MKKIVKVTIGFFTALVSLFAAGFIYINYFIDPDMLRGEVVRAVQNATGRTLTIKGDLDWTLFPNLGLEVDDAILANPEGFPNDPPVASIDALDFSVVVLPLLLERKVIFDEIILEGAVIHLTTLPNGKNNFDGLFKESDKSSKSASTQSKDSSPTETGFDISDFQIIDSSIIWDDQQKKERWDITHLNLDSSDVSLNTPFPIAIKARVANQGNSYIATLDIGALSQIDSATQNITLKDVKVKSDISQKSVSKDDQRLNLTASSIQINRAEDSLAINSLTMNGFGTQANGQIKIKNMSHNMQLSGELRFAKITLGNITLTDLVLPISGHDGVYNIQPLSSKLYGGSLSGKVNVNTKPKNPQWQIHTQTQQIQVHRLLQDLMGEDHITGTLQNNIDLTASGLDESALIHSLNGTTDFQLHNGEYQGIDLVYWWRVGTRLLGLKPSVVTNLQDRKKTTIGNMRGKFKFVNGVGTTRDFQLINNEVIVLATGQIDLVQETVHLDLSVSENKNGKPTGVAVPLVLSGKFGNVTVKPNEKTIAAMAAKILTGNIATDTAGKVIEQAPEVLKQPLNKIKEPAVDALNKLFGK